MIGSMAVANEVARHIDNPENTYRVGSFTEVANGVNVVVLIHGKDDKPNVGKYIEVTVFTDTSFAEQVKAALQAGGYEVKEEPVEEEKSAQENQPNEDDKKKGEQRAE